MDDRCTQLQRSRRTRSARVALRIMARSHTAHAILLVRCRQQQHQHVRALQLAVAAITLHRTSTAARDRRDLRADRSHPPRRTHVALHHRTRRRGGSDDTPRDTDTDIGIGQDDLAVRAFRHRRRRLVDQHTGDNQDTKRPSPHRHANRSARSSSHPTTPTTTSHDARGFTSMDDPERVSANELHMAKTTRTPPTTIGQDHAQVATRDRHRRHKSGTCTSDPAPAHKSGPLRSRIRGSLAMGDGTRRRRHRIRKRSDKDVATLALRRGSTHTRTPTAPRGLPRLNAGAVWRNVGAHRAPTTRRVEVGRSVRQRTARLGLHVRRRQAHPFTSASTRGMDRRYRAQLACHQLRQSSGQAEVTVGGRRKP